MFVYFLSSGTGKLAPIKIGISKNVNSRINNLQTGNPFKIELLFKMPCKSRIHAENLESKLHAIFYRKRMMGEWFDISLSRIDRKLKANDFEVIKLSGAYCEFKDRLASIERINKRLDIELLLKLNHSIDAY